MSSRTASAARSGQAETWVMSTDARMRMAQRRGDAMGQIDDQRAALRERIRAGGIDANRLNLAAYCGDETVRAILGVWPGMCRCGAYAAEVCSQNYDLDRWVGGLQEFGVGAAVRASVAAAWICPQIPESIYTLEAVDVWLRHPSADALGEWLGRWNATAMAAATRVIGHVVLTWLPYPHPVGANVVGETRAAAQVVGEDRVRLVIRNALVSWALA